MQGIKKKKLQKSSVAGTKKSADGAAQHRVAAEASPLHLLFVLRYSSLSTQASQGETPAFLSLLELETQCPGTVLGQTPACDVVCDDEERRQVSATRESVGVSDCCVVQVCEQVLKQRRTAITAWSISAAGRLYAKRRYGYQQDPDVQDQDPNEKQKVAAPILIPHGQTLTRSAI